ncbi:hypothetical protein E8E13_007070 [Curvularia kusanoi]|uniref:S-adenosyl-L-methionine-dependent methyltransferase n=1 Tax=Curvularia kusanoi TaxID=90978 RepID=A0A9P4TDC8_CURKU|nr:hypothetical protein E8E13_007070 [Curvularia kusanoi]
MPRIQTALLRKACAIDPFLPALLAPCRDLHTAQNELRWLREHVEKVANARRARGDTLAKGALLGHLVRARVKGKPLQYLLGTEFFGDLEIKCRPGVLIPRQDTATSVAHLAQLMRDANNLPSELRLIDLCTGSGCIPLLFRHEFAAKRKDIKLRTLGIDISEKSMDLARYNLRKNENDPEVRNGLANFARADVLVDPFGDLKAGAPLPLRNLLNLNRWAPFWDILISNPPYISPSAYWKTTTRSVRAYEPKLALVPPNISDMDDTQQGDMFYPRLLKLAEELEVKIVLLEVADLPQALRVSRLAREADVFDGIEIWRDDPKSAPNQSTNEDGFDVFGSGNARSVVCWRGQGGAWLGKRSLSNSSKKLNPDIPQSVAHSGFYYGTNSKLSMAGMSNKTSTKLKTKLVDWNFAVPGRGR